MDQITALLAWLSSDDNLDILKLIGGVITALVASLWVLFTYFKPRKTSNTSTPRKSTTNLHTLGSLAHHGDGDISIHAIVNINEIDLEQPETPVFKFGAEPPLPPLLIGRRNDVRDLKARLGVADVGQAPAARHSLTVVRGLAGVGKTTIVATLGHDRTVQGNFCDGLLWTSIGQEPNLLHELASWGRALGIEDLHKEDTLAKASERLRGLLKNKRMLLIVDDIWDVSDAQLFRVGGRDCSTLMTTRETKVAEDLADTPKDIYKLDVLSDESAFALLQTLAPSVVDQHSQDTFLLIQVLEGLPLSLQVAGRLLNKEAERGFRAGDLLLELKEGMKLLKALAPADSVDPSSRTIPSVAVLLRKSTDRLDLKTQERFAKLGPFAPKPATFDLMDLQAVWEVGNPKSTVNELIDRGLLEPLGAGRFQMHSLLVWHANSFLTD